MHDIIPYMFDRWAETVVHLFLLKGFYLDISVTRFGEILPLGKS